MRWNLLSSICLSMHLFTHVYTYILYVHALYVLNKIMFKTSKDNQCQKSIKMLLSKCHCWNKQLENVSIQNLFLQGGVWRTWFHSEGVDATGFLISPDRLADTDQISPCHAYYARHECCHLWSGQIKSYRLFLWKIGYVTLLFLLL